MHQKHWTLAVAAALVTITGPSAWANLSYSFEDLIDTWTVCGQAIDAVPVAEGMPFTYTHDLNDEVNFAAGHTVSEAWLELDFTNDATDDHGSFCTIFGPVKWDYREYMRLAYDGNGFVALPAELEVDAGQYPFEIGIDWLNDDGQLDVTIDIYNHLDGCTPLNGAQAIAWLDHSRLYGTAAVPVPVPGALMLGLIGVATTSLRLRRRERQDS